MASKDLIPWTTRAARSASYREMNRLFGDVFLAPFGSVRVNGLSWFGPRSTSHIYKSVNEPVMR